MRRLWLGAGILAALLLLSGCVSFCIERVHAPIAQTLSQAAEAADAQDWEKAKALAEAARARWKDYWYFTAAVADHTPMDELDNHFSELAVFLETKEQPHFSSVCRQLAALAQSFADSQKPTWWNLL